MTDENFRVFARFVGVLVMCLGAYMLWESLWVQSGIDAFAREWGEPLSHSVDHAKWSEMRPNLPTPDTNLLLTTVQGFFGWRASRLGLITFVSCELAGTLLLLASIRRARRAAAA